MSLVSHTCVDCGQRSAPSDSSYSLIGAGGWRLVRAAGVNGTRVCNWRCPECWMTHKQQTGAKTLINVPVAEVAPRTRAGGR